MPTTSFGCRGGQRWRGVVVVAAGMLIHLSLGTLYTFGNLSPYLTSYMRKHGSAPDLTYTECSWVFALACMGQGASMFLGGMIERKIGPILTCLLGGWFMSLGVFLTYFSVKHSFAVTVITYGAMFGFGVGIAYAIPLGCSMRWFPERKGLVNGLVVAGFGGGAFIFDQVQTAFINPKNYKPTGDVNGDKYFTQDEVLESVPKVFLLLGGCYAGMQLIGSLLVRNPPTPEVAMYYTPVVVEFHMETKGKEQPTEDGPTTMEEEQKVASVAGDNDHATITQSALGSVNPVIRDESGKIEEEYNLGPRDMLRSVDFYFLWFMFLLNGQGSTFISTLYKAFGQTFISDDTFMATVGSFAAVFNAGGRILWGTIADRFSFKISSMFMCTAFTCLMLTLGVSVYGGKPLFFIYVCLLFGSFSGSFALFPTATAKCFGRKQLPINYGLVFTSQIITPPLGVFLSQKLKSSIGWNGLFFLVAGFSFVSLILSILFKGKDRKGKEI